MNNATTNLNHCTLNTKFNLNWVRQALWIRLKRFVRRSFPPVVKLFWKQITRNPISNQTPTSFLWFKNHKSHYVTAHIPTTTKCRLSATKQVLNPKIQKLQTGSEIESLNWLALATLWASEIRHQPAPRANEATNEHWHVLRLERFKKLSRQYWIADKEKRTTKWNSEDKDKELSCPSPNAALRRDVMRAILWAKRNWHALRNRS